MNIFVSFSVFLILTTSPAATHHETSNAKTMGPGCPKEESGFALTNGLEEDATFEIS